MSEVVADCLYEKARARGRLRGVDMNNVELILFDGKTTACGTRDLHGCSAIAISSHFAAIVAHIPPRPNASDPALNPYAGDEYMSSKMEQVKNLFRQYSAYFPEARPVVVCALMGGQVVLETQKAIMGATAQSLGLMNTFYRFRGYNVPTNKSNTAAGTMLVDSECRNGRYPLVYVEDRLIFSEDTNQGAQGPQGAQGSQPAQGTHATGQRNTDWVLHECGRYWRYHNGQWQWHPLQATTQGQAAATGHAAAGQAGAGHAAVGQAAAANTSGDWIWDDSHQDYRRVINGQMGILEEAQQTVSLLGDETLLARLLCHRLNSVVPLSSGLR